MWILAMTSQSKSVDIPEIHYAIFRQYLQTYLPSINKQKVSFKHFQQCHLQGCWRESFRLVYLFDICV